MALPKNAVQLIGNLTKDPELKYLANGSPCCEISIAVNERYLDKTRNEWVDKDPLFVEIVFWNKPAEILANNAKKGQQIYVGGSIQCDKWEAQDGTKRSKWKIKGNEWHLIAKVDVNAQGGGGGEEAPPQRQAPASQARYTQRPQGQPQQPPQRPQTQQRVQAPAAPVPHAPPAYDDDEIPF